MPQILKFFYLLSFSSSFFVFQLSCSSHNAFSENQLEKESSPYLLQHAKNPVHWQPWKKDAYQEFNHEKKLVIVSIGYSSCHWCHVMEEETFEDARVADFMNKNFINIKVDREENPEVDNIYMTATQMMTGRGGWTLNVICLPDGRPVYGGTYHTKEQWMEILKKVNEIYSTDESKLMTIARDVANGIQEINTFEVPQKTSLLKPEIFENEMQLWGKQWDETYGGEKQNQKFITPVKYNYIQQFKTLKKDTAIQKYFEHSLNTIAQSGVYDPIDGGFFRYATDSFWEVPHFEIMLYDNAQIIGMYANAFKQSKNPVYKDRVYQSFAFLQQRMANENGGYYFAIDADNSAGEGRFYLFTKETLQQIAEEDLEIFLKSFQINLEKPLDNHYYNLRARTIDTDFLKENNSSKKEFEKKYNLWRSRIKKIVGKREFPLVDSKIITSWNALVVVGFTQAYEAFNDPEFLMNALDTYAFLKNNCSYKNRLVHIFNKETKKKEGFLEDYAYMIQAALQLYKNTGDEKFLNDAISFTQSVQKYFKDDSSPFFTYTEAPTLLTKIVTLDDNVLPSANAIMAENLWALGQLTPQTNYYNQALTMMQGILPFFHQGYSSDYTQWAQLMLKEAYPYFEVVIIGKEAKALSAAFQKQYLPNLLVQISSRSSNLPLLKDRFFEDETYIYVCQNKVCLRPVTTVQEALELLKPTNEILFY